METQTQNRRLRTCLWLVNLLRIHSQGLTLQEINAHYIQQEELSGGIPFFRGTFVNHKNAIMDLMGIAIECNRHTMKYTIAAEEGSSLSQWIMDSFSFGQIVRESKEVRDRILLEETPTGMQFFPLLVDAIRERYALSLTYQKFADQAPYTCRLEPYCVKLVAGRWYVIGRKDDRNHLQSFAFDRITHLTLIEGSTFDFSLPFDPQTYFKDSFGIFHTPEPTQVRLHVYGSAYHFLHTKPLHHSQRETLLSAPNAPEDEQVWEFSYNICPSVDFRNELVRWGASIEVIAPEKFRQEVAEILRKAADRYR